MIQMTCSISCADRTCTAAQMAVSVITHGRGEFRPQSSSRVSYNTQGTNRSKITWKLKEGGQN